MSSASASVNGVVVLAYRVSGAKTAAKNAQDVAAGVKKSGTVAAEATSGFEKFAGGIDKAVKHSTSWIHTAKSMAGAWLGVSAAFEVKDFLKESTEEAIKNQNAMRTLSVALKNTTGATQEQANAIGEMLGKRAEETGFLKTDLMTGYQQLAQATGSTTKARRLLTVAENVSAGSGKSLTTVTSAIMKAYNGTTASLSRLGLKTVTFTKNTIGIQKAQIGVTTAQKAYNDALKKYGAGSEQAVVASKKLKIAHENLIAVQSKAKRNTLSFHDAIKEMGDTFEGQAEAKAASFQGEVSRLSETFNELKIKVGNAILPTLVKLGNFMLNKVVPAVEKQIDKFDQYEGVAGKVHKALNLLFGIAKSVYGFFTAHKSTTRDLALGLLAMYVAINLVAKGILVARGVMTAWNVVQGITVFLSRDAAASYELQGVALNAYMVMTKIAKGAQIAFNLAMAAAPWMLLIIGIAAVVVGIILLVKHWKAVKAALVDGWHAIEHVFVAGWHKIESGASAALKWVKSRWRLLASILGGPIGIAVAVISKHWGQIKSGASSAVHWVTSKFQSIVGFFKSMPGKIGHATAGLFDGIKNAFKAAINFVIRGWDSLQFTMPSVNTHIPGVGTIGGFTIGVPQIPMLAKGGDLRAGQAAIVGDGGRPELFVPKVAGHVYPSVSEGMIAAGLPTVEHSGGRLLVHAHIDLDGERVFDGILGAAQKQGALS